MSKLTEDKETLEYLIDAYGLNEVLEMIADIAADKASHIRSNWQDEVSSATWDRAADNLTIVAADVFKRPIL